MAKRPDRYQNAIVPHIDVEGASDGIAFYERALGAKELFRIARPDGKILHAELSICGSTVMIGDPDHKFYSEPKALGRTTAGLHRNEYFVSQADVIEFGTFEDAGAIGLGIRFRHGEARFLNRFVERRGSVGRIGF